MWEGNLEKKLLRLVRSNLSQCKMSALNSNPTRLGMVLLFKNHLEGFLSGGQSGVGQAGMGVGEERQSERESHTLWITM